MLPKLTVVTWTPGIDQAQTYLLTPDTPAQPLPETAYVALLLQTDAPIPLTAMGVGEEWWPLDLLAPGWYIARDPLTSEVMQLPFGEASTLSLRPSFRNRFGQCRLYVANADNTDRDRLGTLLISTSKASQEQLGQMLTYLWERQVNVATDTGRVGISDLPYQSTAGRLASLRADLAYLTRQQPLFRVAPLTRLQPALHRVSHPDHALLTDQAIAYLLANPASLELADGPAPDTFLLANRWFRIGDVLTETLENSTETPENSLIHGYLADVAGYLNGLVQGLAISESNPQTSWMGNSYPERLTQQVRQLQRQVANWQQFAREYLPVRQPAFLLPPVLTGFDHSEHYRRTGQLIRNWFTSNVPSTDQTTDWLTGVRSVDTLYELVCLYQWLDAWQTLGYQWHTFESQADADYPERGHYRLLHPNGNRVTVSYECLPPGYGTTMPYRSDLPLRPDFLVEWRPVDEPAQWLVADAKFRPALAVREQDLSRLVLRYIHGLGPLKPRHPAPIGRGLVLLHPTVPATSSGRAGFWFWQYPRYDWFGEQPAIQQIGQVAVAVSGEPGALQQLVARWAGQP
ncbi:hypothetical protein [uncultured Fibrella sp.]|uniref:hypothetical protein n=1 Tax=uncultured Fibrella sp. TaxID=1284596 RepID=UPI0035CAB0EB